MATYSGISQAAFDLIVSEEVSSEATYNARYQRPERPGGQSGITVGIGYDCGYATPARIRADWGGHIPEAMVDDLAGVAGFTGDRAQGALAGIRPRVQVPWKAAIDVFANTDIPRWTATVRRSLPNCDKLSPDSFGALVSLAYNRGASFVLAGDRYAEMRAIRAHMIAMEFAKITGEFRAMKRLWTTPSVRGVASRRDHEAALFQRGLTDMTQIGAAPPINIPPPARQVIPNPPPAPVAKPSKTATAGTAGAGAVIAGTVVAGAHQGWPLSYWLIAASVGLLAALGAYLFFKKASQ